MKSVFIHLSMVAACFIFLASPAIAYTPVTHSELQEVFDDGTSYWASIHPTCELYPVVLAGVVINNPEDMSNYTSYSPDVWWQTFIQALPVGDYDYGGTALYMRATKPWDTSIVLYDAEEWVDELDKMLTNSDTLHYGDIVAVQANAPGMFFRGKYNINEQHSNDPAKDFTVMVIGHMDPIAETITLDKLKSTDPNPDIFDTFIFDETRATGCEHYQSSLVHLEGLQLMEGEGDYWVKDGTVKVQQTVEVEGDWHTLTFNLKLGQDLDLFNSSIVDAVENNPFDLTAILDQEAYDSLTGEYRLWLTSASNLTVAPEPGSLALLVAGGLAALLLWRRRCGRTTS